MNSTCSLGKTPPGLSLRNPSSLQIFRYLLPLVSGTEFTLRLEDGTGASEQ